MKDPHDNKTLSIVEPIMYLIQVGRHKGSYRTKYSINNMPQAVGYYNGINIGLGYKKRLIAYNTFDGSKVTLARHFS